MYVLAMIIWSSGFLNPQQFLDIFNNNAYLIVISCGLTIVMITAGIDISVGGTVALITMTCVVFLEDYSGNVVGSMILVLSIGLAMGISQGFFVA
jgi:galactofuranose transport system permease protein